MFAVSSRPSPLFFSPTERLSEEIENLSVLGKGKEYGEFVPIALDYSFAVLSSADRYQSIPLVNLPFYFGKFPKEGETFVHYHHLCNGYNYKALTMKVGIYNYKFVVGKGMLLDFFTQKPLFVVAYLKEYEDTIKRINYNEDNIEYDDSKLLLFVDRNLKNTSFLRNFLNLYPQFKDKLNFTNDLRGFLDGIKLDQLKGSIEDFQINSLNNFLKENKVDESVLSGESGELLKVEEL